MSNPFPFNQNILQQQDPTALIELSLDGLSHDECTELIWLYWCHFTYPNSTPVSRFQYLVSSLADVHIILTELGLYRVWHDEHIELVQHDGDVYGMAA